MDDILIDERDGIRVFMLNKPERLNAWDMAMRRKLGALLTDAGKDARGVVLTGTGERSFSAGQDLNESQHFDASDAETWIDEFRSFYNALRRFEKPLVVALNGLAAGSAFQAALLADMRIGHPDVTMGQPEINSGILSMTGFWIIREHLGLARATDLVLTGRFMKADECERIGIINVIVPREDVLSKAIAVAADLASKPALAFQLDKRRICAATQAGFDDAFEAARVQHRVAFESGASQAVMESFLKR